MVKTADHYHAKDLKEVFAALQTHSIGLTNDDAAHRTAEYGLNEIRQGKRINPFSIFARQFRNLMVVVLLLAAGLSAYYQHYLDMGVILFVIFLNSVIGFIQEYRAETAIASLKKLVVQKALVRRNGIVIELPAVELVPGDIIVVSEGNKIPADARIITATNALSSESLLTGESEPVHKMNSQLPYETPLADRTNMLFSGTILVRGHVEAIVVATGQNSVLGGIATSLSTIKESSGHFQQKNTQLVKQMSIIAFVTAITTFVVGFYLRGIPFESILPFTLAALVSAIPESLPIIIIVILSLSAHRMAKRNAIVRTLPSTETLSVVNIIITDKTGTLTQNKMSVAQVVLPKRQKDNNKLLSIAQYCNNIHPERLIGDPTELAFYSYAVEQNTKQHSDSEIEKVEDYPFNQHIKARATLVKTPHGYELYVAGAPESLLSKSTLTKNEQVYIEKQLASLTNDAMRPIGFGYRKLKQRPKEITQALIENLTWAGAVGLIDPPRPESLDAVLAAQKAGITVIMATGDHPKTALSIAKQVGLTTNDIVLTAADLEVMTDTELLESAKTTTVYARMTPDAKLRLAQVLQKSGYVVAMTGDGVNDAPSLKNADIGIAMGRGGTDVSREASDIILADDNFATIIAAIEEGRTQFRNIRRTSFFLITTNLAESVSLLTFLLLGLPLPLLAKQILWLNLVGSGVTDIALATEGIHEDVLDSPPQSKNESVLSKSMLPLLILLIAIMTAAALIVFQLILPQGEIKARTAVFVILSLMQIVNMYNMRSLKKSVFQIGIFNNRNINLAAAASIGLLLLVLYIPKLAILFDFVPLTGIEFGIFAFASLSVIVGGEIVKKLPLFKFH